MLDPVTRGELIELTHRYFRGVDTQDPEALSSCLTDDVVAEHSMVGAVHGLDQFVAVIKRLPPQVLMTQHFLTNHEIDGNDREATIRAYLFAQHVVRSDAGEQLMPGGAFYEFRCSRTAAGWRIAWLRNSVKWSDPGLAEIFKPLQ